MKAKLSKVTAFIISVALPLAVALAGAGWGGWYR